ncbi:dGTP triphosphohydrolase [Halomonas sp. QHL1]|uniref:dGTP triphosphohydrolase n=1 Tax=Halomonas sp. QHL1 TaxID=1123773 RepID=UPI0008FCE9C3|nr:dNTP triphosphohydrolase [Halomonas sp. QHL1]OJA05151.1 hypothetical protein QHL1GM_06965 [Halomonas sp. QHL1]
MSDQVIFNWEKLLSSKRRSKDEEKEITDIWSCDRTEIERDYDRIVFSAPTRRLANKTQVFPMEEHDSIRTRLTHSNEVSNLARGAGVTLCCNGFFKNSNIDRDRLIRDIPALLATIGIVHDMGNPPFGHQGEKAIQDWFSNHLEKNENKNNFQDFLNFDGNAQTLRLVTSLHSADGHFGMDLTTATLSAMVKYPVFNAEKHGFSKGGVFISEKKIFEEVWKKTGLREGIRHPLCYILEICDDIAYATIDAEDTIKKGYASYSDLKNWLKEELGDNDFFNEIYDKILEAVGKFKHRHEKDITSEVQKEVSVEIFRSITINKLLACATDCFAEDFYSEKHKLWFSRGEGIPYEICKNFKYKKEIKALKNFTKNYGFNNTSVLKLELQGRNRIHELMDHVWLGIKNTDEELKTDNHYEKYILSKISVNYLREFKRKHKTAIKPEDKLYAKYQLLTDYISGMTESYLERTYSEILPLYQSFIK